MKTFYLLRNYDYHHNTGIGLVAEGAIFDSGMCALTWLTPYPTVTIFPDITIVKKIHGHDGTTEIIIEGKHKKFDECKEAARLIRIKKKRKDGNK